LGRCGELRPVQTQVFPEAVIKMTSKNAGSTCGATNLSALGWFMSNKNKVGTLIAKQGVGPVGVKVNAKNSASESYRYLSHSVS